MWIRLWRRSSRLGVTRNSGLLMDGLLLHLVFSTFRPSGTTLITHSLYIQRFLLRFAELFRWRESNSGSHDRRRHSSLRLAGPPSGSRSASARGHSPPTLGLALGTAFTHFSCSPVCLFRERALESTPLFTTPIAAVPLPPVAGEMQRERRAAPRTASRTSRLQSASADEHWTDAADRGTLLVPRDWRRLARKARSLTSGPSLFSSRSHQLRSSRAATRLLGSFTSRGRSGSLCPSMTAAFQMSADASFNLPDTYENDAGIKGGFTDTVDGHPSEPTVTPRNRRSPLGTDGHPSEPTVTRRNRRSPLGTGGHPSEPTVTPRNRRSPLGTGGHPSEPTVTRRNRRSPLGTGGHPSEPTVTLARNGRSRCPERTGSSTRDSLSRSPAKEGTVAVGCVLGPGLLGHGLGSSLRH